MVITTGEILWVIQTLGYDVKDDMINLEITEDRGSNFGKVIRESLSDYDKLLPEEVNSISFFNMETERLNVIHLSELKPYIRSKRLMDITNKGTVAIDPDIIDEWVIYKEQ